MLGIGACPMQKVTKGQAGGGGDSEAPPGKTATPTLQKPRLEMLRESTQMRKGGWETPIKNNKSRGGGRKSESRRDR